jgi:hypothetical protein
MLRLHDTYTSATHTGDFSTVDPMRNARIDPRASLSTPKELEREIAGESEEAQEAIRAAYRTEMARPRRIDYLFVNGFFPDHCLRQELFGTGTNAAGFPASDHFGILSRYTRDRSPCRQQARPADPASSVDPGAR